MGIKSNNKAESYFNFFGESGADASGVAPSPITATGGDATYTYNGNKIHVFTTSGPATFNVSSGFDEVEYVIVGGGGGGGNVETNANAGAGGGAPGMPDMGGMGGMGGMM